MKLYYVPGTCSMASHIVVRELGLDVDMHKVDFATKQTEQGEDFDAVNPKGYVPALVLDDGETLTEGAAILQYLGDQKPETGLTPEYDSMARYRLQEWLTFISSELHKGMAPLFNPHIADGDRAFIVDKVKGRFGVLAGAVDDSTFLLGDQFTVADAYALVMLRWTDMFQIDLSDMPALGTYREALSARPAVQAAVEAEGLPD